MVLARFGVGMCVRSVGFVAGEVSVLKESMSSLCSWRAWIFPAWMCPRLCLEQLSTHWAVAELGVWVHCPLLWQTKRLGLFEEQLCVQWLERCLL